MATSGRYALIVGAVVLLAAVLLGGMFTFFTQSGLFHHSYTLDVLFDNAHSVEQDSPVELAGVQIGTVQSVSLQGQRADLRLKIRDQYKIPRDSQFLITTPLLGSAGVVSVVPPPDAATANRGYLRPGEANLQGERTADFTASAVQINDLLSQLTETARKADALIDSTTQTTRGVNRLIASRQIQNNLEQTTGNIRAASANSLELTNRLNAVLAQDNAQVLGLLRQTRAGAQVSLNNIADTTAQVRQTARENRDNLNSIISDLRDTTGSVSAITAQVSDTLKNGGVTQNLSATVANLKATTDHLNAISTNLANLSGDQSVQNDLKATVHNVRATTEQADYLLERLNHLAGTKPRPATVVVTPGGSAVVVPSIPTVRTAPTAGDVPPLLPRVELLQNLRSSHFRVDADAVLPLTSSPGVFGRAGIYGLGDTNNLILQAGQAFGSNALVDVRAGLYASKLSVGGDLGLGRPESLSFDLYDPNRLHMDSRGVIMLSKEIGLVLGAEDITRRTGYVAGIELRQSR